MQVQRCEIEDVLLVTPKILQDARGFFSEVYNMRDLETAGITNIFVQDNHSLSVRAGTVRGLHFQRPPFAQAKLVRVVRGRIVDFAVDLRPNAPTFGRHVRRELSAANWSQLYIPVGFAHGFCTLEPDTEVVYKQSAFYEPTADAGVLWNDPALGLEWPVRAGEAILSDKDTRWPALADLGPVF